ncbi:MAG TPA: M48 family metalloprotease [Stellaceae bacterium]|nr:M48 family metalloprotease [Stellaceae bacterium]
MSRDKPQLSERLHSIFVQGWGLKNRDFSHQSADRAMAILNRARAPLAPMVGEVLWMPAPIAFTLPGQYAYISRRFIERCTSDAPVAFALAHEIGHHDLGHLDRAERWMAANILTHTSGQLAFMALSLWSRWLYSRENELAADSYALDLCRKAGFDLRQCLKSFDILSWYALDHNDFDGVYGQDDELELDPKRATGTIDRIYIETRLWVARHRRSHPSLHERRQTLLMYLSKVEANARNTSP